MKRQIFCCYESKFGSLVVIINKSNPRKEIIFSLQTERIIYRHDCLLTSCVVWILDEYDINMIELRYNYVVIIS